MKKLKVFIGFLQVIDVFCSNRHVVSSEKQTPLLDAMKKENKRNIVIQGAEALAGSSVKGAVNTVGNIALVPLAVTTLPTRAVLGSSRAAYHRPVGYSVLQPVVKTALKPFKQIARAGKAVWLVNSDRAARRELKKLDSSSAVVLSDKLTDPSNLKNNLISEDMYNRNKGSKSSVAEMSHSNESFLKYKYNISKALSDAGIDLRFKKKIDSGQQNRAELNKEVKFPTLSGKAGIKELESYYADENARGEVNIDLEKTRNAQYNAMKAVADQASLGTKLFKRKSLKAAMKEAAKNVDSVLIENNNQSDKPVIQNGNYQSDYATI